VFGSRHGRLAFGGDCPTAVARPFRIGSLNRDYSSAWPSQTIVAAEGLFTAATFSGNDRDDFRPRKMSPDGLADDFAPNAT
jgi:hypothetical protein